MYLIHHHLGLGDHIICNGLVRQLAKVKDVTLAVKHKNLANVCRMFNDIPIEYYLIDKDESTGNIGWCFGGDKRIKFDEAFYKQAVVNFEERWNSFYIERDVKKERQLIEYICPSKKFCLVHNTASAGKVNINIETDLPIVELHKTPIEKSIFDWMGIIELASEIHCINSSFIHLVDSMQPIAKLYFHDDRSHLQFSKKLNWRTLGVGADTN
jgi:hypothetical protein